MNEQVFQEIFININVLFGVFGSLVLIGWSRQGEEKGRKLRFTLMIILCTLVNMLYNKYYVEGSLMDSRIAYAIILNIPNLLYFNVKRIIKGTILLEVVNVITIPLLLLPTGFIIEKLIYKNFYEDIYVMLPVFTTLVVFVSLSTYILDKKFKFSDIDYLELGKKIYKKIRGKICMKR